MNNLALGFNTRKQLKQKVVQKSTETIESSCKGLVHANTKICNKKLLCWYPVILYSGATKTESHSEEHRDY